ncbi:helix-turn-helix transcriptional regulator [Streptomyces sp. N35]|uniref:helix-turn-helix domain-containing protein n=1 Tax=Streptomyces sp. N35 TaxID=2795730 RepID=UPI0018F501A9|nr:helix-turn-helix transcriptional regulator [Streptomyces sp. N35]
MTRWKPLPGALPERERQLAVQLRRLKDRGGLSFTALAAKTSYSSSSWERCLNGKKPVPREAVEELARLCGADATRLLVLHEAATATASADRTPHPPPLPATGDARRTSMALMSRREADAVPAGHPADEPPPQARSARGGTLAVARTVRGRLIAGALIATAFGAGLLVGAQWLGAGERAPATTAEYRVGATYACENVHHDGRLYTGHSATREALLEPAICAAPHCRRATRSRTCAASRGQRPLSPPPWP